MTAPLPTREWLAGFLGRFHAKALTNPSAWVEFVDELEARLRPAWEAMEQQVEGIRDRLTEREQFIRENAGPLLADRDAKIERQRVRLAQLEQSQKSRNDYLDTLKASLARKDEALRACGKALGGNQDASDNP